ncbi:MAG: hypothetical protein PHO56_01035 [Patescibacteria group bacterium]|nr:hypothetical protein [Patescibacteria group bacterium]
MKIILYLFILLSVYWLVKILVSFFWMKRSERAFYGGERKANRPFFVVIPVIEEKDIIFATIDYFLNLIKPFPGSKLIIVTTAKEDEICKKNKEAVKVLASKGVRNEIVSLIKSDFGADLSGFKDIEILKNKALEVISEYKNTIDVLKDCHREGVMVINYPFISGKMAHQLNYCLKLLINKGFWHNELLGIYNADSRPDSETFFWLNQRSNGSSLVFQQYGKYFGNTESILKSDFISRAILISSCIWQNRWSVGFEMFNSLKQFIFLKKKIIGERFLHPLNYCIGHGLFFTRDIYEKYHFFEDTHNEDAIFGLGLSYAKKTIFPIPFFDVADAPNTVKSLFFQKATWFFGPFQAPLYFKKLKGMIPEVDGARLFFLSSKLFFHAIFWVIGPTCLLFIFLYSLATLNFEPFLLAYFTFLVLPGFLVYLLFPDKKIKAGEALIFLLFGSFFAYVMHGASAYYSIFLAAKAKITNGEVDKYKTKILRS